MFPVTKFRQFHSRLHREDIQRTDNLIAIQRERARVRNALSPSLMSLFPPSCSSNTAKCKLCQRSQFVHSGGRPKERFGGISAESLGRKSFSFGRKNIFHFGISAETVSFGRNTHFRQKFALSVSYDTQIEWFQSCRMREFLPKDTLLVERASFGSFSISAEMEFLESLSFGFRKKDKNSLSVSHWSRLRVVKTFVRPLPCVRKPLP